MRVAQISNRDDLVSQVQEAIHRNPESHYQHRLHVVLVVLQFRNVQYAVELYQEPKRTIQYWMQQFFAHGVEGLRDDPKSGRPSQLTESQKQELQKVIQNSPRELGYEQNDWDGKLLSYHIAKQYHLTLKVRRCQYLFHELGFTLQRPGAIATGDPVAQAEFKKKPMRSWQK